MIHIRTVLLLSVAACAVAGCQSTPSTRSSRAASAACRAEVDRVYAAQNRVDLSRRDQRDTPFAGNYISGDTSRGLSDRYRRDRLADSCVTNAGATATPDAGTGPTFSPAAQ